jgi:hypothetical protein
MAKAKDKYENFKAPIRRETGKSKPREMNRTSGVAGRRAASTAGKLLTGKEIKTAMNTGGPLTGSASGVKKITLQQAGEVLTSGIVTLGKKGLQADPMALAMALPVGKAFGVLGKIAGVAGKVSRIAPASVRISGAAGRVVRGAARRGQAAETAIQLGKGLKETGGYAKGSANVAKRSATQTYAAGKFSNAETVFDGVKYTAPTRYGSNEALKSAGKSTAYDLAQLGESRVKKGGQMIYDATKTLARTTNRVEGGTREAAAEIRRRLAAIKGGKKVK